MTAIKVVIKRSLTPTHTRLDLLKDFYTSKKMYLGSTSGSTMRSHNTTSRKPTGNMSVFAAAGTSEGCRIEGCSEVGFTMQFCTLGNMAMLRSSTPSHSYLPCTQSPSYVYIITLLSALFNRHNPLAHACTI